jgi:hypothetical protein
MSLLSKRSLECRDYLSPDRIYLEGEELKLGGSIPSPVEEGAFYIIRSTG